MTAFYNEHDPYSAQWLRNLIAAGHIAPGIVDERDIQDIEPYELAGFTQVHMFAGIGVWSAALRRNNWPDDRPIWTGSAPCQSFSNAGKRKGTKDARHLFPVWKNLIAQCKPSVVIGEQVASKDGRDWLGGNYESLQNLRDRENVIGILSEFQRANSTILQNLRAKNVHSTQARKPRADSPSLFGMADTEAWTRFGECRKTPREIQKYSFQNIPEGYSTSHRFGDLRINRHSLRFENSASVERPLIRSNKTGGGIYPSEHPSGSVCFECHGEHLGERTHCRDCPCDFCEASSAERMLASLARVQIEGESRSEFESSVSLDLEALGFVVGASDLCAAGFGEAHLRQRLYFVGLADDDTGLEGRAGMSERGNQRALGPGGLVVGLGIPNSTGSQPREQRSTSTRQGCSPLATSSIGTTPTIRDQGEIAERWLNVDWLLCRNPAGEPSWRPVESRTFPLAHGITNRMGKLRAYGNALDLETASAFVACVKEICNGI